jgi:hypothetical protein
MNPSTKPTTKPTENNSFLAILQKKELTDNTLTDLSEKLCEAAIAAERTGKKASLALTIGVEPESGALKFSAKIKTTLPVADESLCLFYIGDDGKLTRDDPKQRKFEFREVTGGRALERSLAEQGISATVTASVG